MFFLLADIISKITINIIINEYNEREVMQVNNMDLQSIQFVSYMIKNIKVYKNDNVITTSRCSDFIDYTTKCFLLKIPENKTILEQELLKKILPLGFDKEYYRYENENENANVNSNANSNANAKQFTMISILFTDIVNYTELAKKYDDKIIFDLLNDVYNKFDNIIKKYSHLQKIETIGDAYMVVGDIYRDTFNHKIVIKEIILFALELIKEIKLIKTPDKLPLSIRIGINMGQVSIGILGSEIPRLCVVGNAVNVAARLQSTADPNTIQMSRHIYEQIDELDFDMKFETKFKENVFLKNIGSVNTYNIHP
jgi:class 3 adenylate cyclase